MNESHKEQHDRSRCAAIVVSDARSLHAAQEVKPPQQQPFRENGLPDDAMSEILSYFNRVEDMARFCQVSRFWRKAMSLVGEIQIFLDGENGQQVLSFVTLHCTNLTSVTIYFLRSAYTESFKMSIFQLMDPDEWRRNDLTDHLHRFISTTIPQLKYFCFHDKSEVCLHQIGCFAFDPLQYASNLETLIIRGACFDDTVNQFKKTFQRIFQNKQKLKELELSSINCTFMHFEDVDIKLFSTLIGKMHKLSSLTFHLLWDQHTHFKFDGELILANLKDLRFLSFYGARNSRFAFSIPKHCSQLEHLYLGHYPKVVSDLELFVLILARNPVTKLILTCVTSERQVKALCIASRTLETITVLFDYLPNPDSITKAADEASDGRVKMQYGIV